ncbi:hypothetical protein BDP27DRAFT_1327709 [Rhodocollybia butyracea]|uniref:Uncharacterized protein n=1 Tax=Rhodocollybia butyracea TaxID=206335 RepID=A0A9P5PS24_9AGAR|nr:hypothetical protein BDP27DRAFT_1327709 [Rhodocollybia butyracea]
MTSSQSLSPEQLGCHYDGSFENHTLLDILHHSFPDNYVMGKANIATATRLPTPTERELPEEKQLHWLAHVPDMVSKATEILQTVDEFQKLSSLVISPPIAPALYAWLKAVDPATSDTHLTRKLSGEEDAVDRYTATMARPILSVLSAIGNKECIITCYSAKKDAQSEVASSKKATPDRVLRLSEEDLSDALISLVVELKNINALGPKKLSLIMDAIARVQRVFPQAKFIAFEFRWYQDGSSNRASFKEGYDTSLPAFMVHQIWYELMSTDTHFAQLTCVKTTIFFIRTRIGSRNVLLFSEPIASLKLRLVDLVAFYYISTTPALKDKMMQSLPSHDTLPPDLLRFMEVIYEDQENAEKLWGRSVNHTYGWNQCFGNIDQLQEAFSMAGCNFNHYASVTVDPTLNPQLGAKRSGRR